jgi:excisionase family DNA binding protein
MNLAEAIRQAATAENVSFANNETVLPATDKAVHHSSFAPDPHGAQESDDDAAGAQISVSSTLTNTENHAVRIDLVLSPEQLSALFRGVAEAERSVLTNREAAHYLRIPGRKLQEMAELGQIPAFLIDGKWRFSRNSVDEWLTKQSARKEMEA